MIKIYGMPTCPYCDFVHQQIQGRENEFEYINIGENIRNMSAFTHLRDNSPVFDHCKEIGDVGMYGAPAACSIEDHRSGRKGC